jgi:hypothetical protein
MEFKAIKPIGIMAVVTNPETREVEAVDMDTLKLYSLVVNHATKAMQLAFVWGGYDSTGKFHVSSLPASHRSIQANVEGERQIWEACCCDDKGNPVTDHGTDFVRKVLLEHNKLADIVNGGWDLKDLELVDLSVPRPNTVFKKVNNQMIDVREKEKKNG